MRVHVVRPDDLGPSEAELWDKFQHTTPATLNPFYSLTFTQAVGRVRSNVRVAVAEDGAGIEAFLPFELASSSVALPVGWPMNDLQGFIGSGVPIDARSIIRKARLRGWRFDHAPMAQGALVPHHYPESVVNAPVVDLSDGYTSYMAARRGSSARRLAEKSRSLQRHHGTVSLDWHSPDPVMYLPKIAAWKSGKYHGAGQLFADPTVLRLLEELVTTNQEHCHGIVSVLFAGDREVAIHLGLAGPSGLSWWLPAYDPEIGRFSPGTLMLFAIAEEAANRGVTRLDLGYGQDAYKFRVANASYSVMGGAVWASRAEEAARKAYRQFRNRRLRKAVT